LNDLLRASGRLLFAVESGWDLPLTKSSSMGDANAMKCGVTQLKSPFLFVSVRASSKNSLDHLKVAVGLRFKVRERQKIKTCCFPAPPENVLLVSSCSATGLTYLYGEIEVGR
jgi:hypothetical protein